MSSGEKNLLADNLSLITMYCIYNNCCSMVYGLVGNSMEGQELLSFLKEAENLHIVLHVFGRDFLSPRTTIVSVIKNYPSTSMSCCSNGLAQLLPCLDL